VNDLTFRKGGARYISEKIQEAISNESRTATICGKWEIEREIRLPSNFTLILENTHLKMADGVYSNLFVNQNHDTEIGTTPQGTDRNISLIGRGEAILDGGRYNGLSEKTQFKDGLPPIWKNNLLLFTNVEGFLVEGISCRNQRWWALNFIYCSHGSLKNLDFCASDLGIDENGKEYHGLKRGFYSQVVVKNADGIDLRQGCHDISIENVTGFTEDDSVALTALNGRMERRFAVKEFSPDICNVTVKNVRTAAYCSNVRLLNQGGIPLHDIFVDGVYDEAEQSPHMDRGVYAVRVGDSRLYGERHSTCEETYNISIRNVRGGGKCAVSLAGAVRNLTMLGIEAVNGAKMISDERTDS